MRKFFVGFFIFLVLVFSGSAYSQTATATSGASASATNQNLIQNQNSLSSSASAQTGRIEVGVTSQNPASAQIIYSPVNNVKNINRNFAPVVPVSPPGLLQDFRSNIGAAQPPNFWGPAILREKNVWRFQEIDLVLRQKREMIKKIEVVDYIINPAAPNRGKVKVYLSSSLNKKVPEGIPMATKIPPGTPLIGWVRVYVDIEDLNNKKGARIDDLTALFKLIEFAAEKGANTVVINTWLWDSGTRSRSGDKGVSGVFTGVFGALEKMGGGVGPYWGSVDAFLYKRAAPFIQAVLYRDGIEWKPAPPPPEKKKTLEEKMMEGLPQQYQVIH